MERIADQELDRMLERRNRPAAAAQDMVTLVTELREERDAHDVTAGALAVLRADYEVVVGSIAPKEGLEDEEGASDTDWPPVQP